MTPKPHRVIIERVSGYASEAAAYVRRRRQLREPFARIQRADGTGVEHAPGTELGDRMQADATAAIEALDRSAGA